MRVSTPILSVSNNAKSIILYIYILIHAKILLKNTKYGNCIKAIKNI